MKACLWTSLTMVALLTFSTGCTTLPTRAEIPCGEWSGHGMFVLHKWKGDESSEAAREILQHGEYPTWLKIEKTTIDDNEGVRMEILSKRGKIETLEGDRTHIIMRLRPTETLADDAITLYHLAEFGLSDDEDAPGLEKGTEGTTYATCMRAAGQIVLRVHYFDGFSDTFRFRGNAVHKDGAYFDSDEGVIRWTEWLRRER